MAAAFWSAMVADGGFSDRLCDGLSWLELAWPRLFPQKAGFFYQYFALSNEGLAHGYIWQLVTYQFMHAGFMHLFFNGWAIYVFGIVLEAKKKSCTSFSYVLLGLDRKTKWLAVKKPVADLGGDAWSKRISHLDHANGMKKKIDLLLDGKVGEPLDVADADITADRGNPFHAPEYIILNQAIGGQCGGDPSPTKFPIRFRSGLNARVYQHDKAPPALGQ